MTPTILCYTPTPAPWEKELRQLCALQAIRLRRVETPELECKVETLAQGLRPARLSDQGAPLGEPMLVLCGLSSGQLERLLAALARAGARSCLKAVLTPHNAQWTLRALYAELVRERLQLS